MEKEYLIIAIARAVLLLFSFLALPPGVLMIKTAWIENDHKKLKRGVFWTWAAIAAMCFFLKLVRGIS